MRCAAWTSADPDVLVQQCPHRRRNQDARPVQALYLLASGQARYRTTVASLVGVSRGTVGRWLTTYTQGGLLALLDVYVPAGKAPALTPAQVTQLQAVLDQPAGFASYGAVQRWIVDELGVEMGYHAVHKLVRYNLRAKLKVPRPSHIKKRKRRSRISS